MRFNSNEAIAEHLIKFYPEICEIDKWDSKTICVRIPIEAPSEAITRNENVMELLNRVKRFNKNWVQTGHIKGDNFNNVSATISIKDNEWNKVGNWLWNNRKFYTGISVLPWDNGTYVQAPFEVISQKDFKEIDIELSSIYEQEDNVSFTQEIACQNGLCDVN